MGLQSRQVGEQTQSLTPSSKTIHVSDCSVLQDIIWLSGCPTLSANTRDISTAISRMRNWKHYQHSLIPGSTGLWNSLPHTPGSFKMVVKVTFTPCKVTTDSRARTLMQYHVLSALVEERKKEISKANVQWYTLDDLRPYHVLYALYQERALYLTRTEK